MPLKFIVSSLSDSAGPWGFVTGQGSKRPSLARNLATTLTLSQKLPLSGRVYRKITRFWMATNAYPSR